MSRATNESLSLSLSSIQWLRYNPLINPTRIAGTYLLPNHTIYARPIPEVTIKKLLSRTSSTDELAKHMYLAQQTIEYAGRNEARAVVVYGCKCKRTKRDMSYLKSDQEESDIKIVLHALDATANGATEISIHSPDTDVFILAQRHYPDLCQNTIFVTGKGWEG